MPRRRAISAIVVYRKHVLENCCSATASMPSHRAFTRDALNGLRGNQNTIRVNVRARHSPYFLTFVRESPSDLIGTVTRRRMHDVRRSRPVPNSRGPRCAACRGDGSRSIPRARRCCSTPACRRPPDCGSFRRPGSRDAGSPCRWPARSLYLRSRKVFMPAQPAVPDRCHYCTFPPSPPLPAPYFQTVTWTSARHRPG